MKNINKKVYVTYLMFALIISLSVTGLLSSTLASTTGKDESFISVSTLDFVNNCILINNANNNLCIKDNYELTIDGNVLSFDKFVRGYIIQVFDGENIVLKKSLSGVTQFKTIPSSKFGEPEPPKVSWSKTTAKVGDNIKFQVKTVYGPENTKLLNFCEGINKGVVISPNGYKYWYIQNNFVAQPLFYENYQKISETGVWKLKGIIGWKCKKDLDNDGKIEVYYAYNEVYNTATIAVTGPVTPPAYKTPSITNVVADDRIIAYKQNFKISAKVSNAERVKIRVVSTKEGHDMTDINKDGVYEGILHYSMFKPGTQQIEIIAKNGNKYASKKLYITIQKKPTTTTTTTTTIVKTTTTVGGTTTTTLPQQGETKWCTQLKNKIPISEWTEEKCKKQLSECETKGDCELPPKTPVPTSAPGCTDVEKPVTTPESNKDFEPVYDNDGCIVKWKIIKDEEPCPGYFDDPSCLFEKPKLQDWFTKNMKNIGLSMGIFTVLAGIGYIVMKRKK